MLDPDTASVRQILWFGSLAVVTVLAAAAGGAVELAAAPGVILTATKAKTKTITFAAPTLT